MARLLVVEDDETIGATLTSTLREHGHHVVWEQRGYPAVDAAAATDFELVLLDLGLPDLDGVEVCRRIRGAQPGAVLVVLTARTDEMDVVVGLEAGADDYLTKPVRLAELHARIRAHLRRAAPVTGAVAPATIGDLVVDPVSRRVSVRGREVPMRGKEFDLLSRFVAEPGVAIRRDTLMADVWDAHWFGSTKTLDVHVAALRRRLAEVAPGARLPHIVTLRGHGYRLEPPAPVG